MRVKTTVAAATILSSISVYAFAQAGPAPTPSFEAEKCYGIAKAGKNDCASTGNNSCSGTSKADGDGHAWMYVPAGTCEKIVGGSLEPKSA